MDNYNKSRGGALTAWLIFSLIMNGFGVIYYLFFGNLVTRTLPNLPDWVLPFLIAASAANFICDIALWDWKRGGFYGFCAVAALVFFVNIISGAGASSFLGLIGVGILWYLLSSKWEQFE